MDHPSPEALRPAFEAAAGQRDALIADAEARTVRFVWATGPLSNLRPFEAETNRLSLGKRLPGRPKTLDGNYEIGFDAAGEQVLRRIHGNLKGNSDVTVISRGAGSVDVWNFDSSGDVASVERLYFGSRGEPRTWAALGAYGSQSEVYEYEGTVLSAIERRSASSPRTYVYRITYDERKTRALEITSQLDDHPAQVFYRAPQRSTPTLLALLRERWLELVPQVASAIPIAADDRVWCVCLAYGDESYEELVEPQILLGLERERAAWRSRGAPVYELWDVNAFATMELHSATKITAPDVVAAAAELTDHLRQRGTTEPVKKLLREVARALNTIDWTPYLPVTDDFLVYAVNVEGGDLQKNLKAILSKDVMKRLRTRGQL